MAHSTASPSSLRDRGSHLARAPAVDAGGQLREAVPEAGASVVDRRRMGERLRAIRKARGFTLQALSDRSGVALSTISKMELGQISIGYEKFAAVTRVLKADVARLLDPAAAPPPAHAPVFVHARVADRSPVAAGEAGGYRMLAADFPGRRMEPLHGRLQAHPADAGQDFTRHAGQRFVIVLSGKVRVCFETGDEVRLRRGESLYFDSGIGHRYLCVGRTGAEIVAVTTTGQ
jgi:transcriptional regulator with XRE-family HTH domain